MTTRERVDPVRGRVMTLEIINVFFRLQYITINFKTDDTPLAEVLTEIEVLKPCES